MANGGSVFFQLALKPDAFFDVAPKYNPSTEGSARFAMPSPTIRTKSGICVEAGPSSIGEVVSSTMAGSAAATVVGDASEQNSTVRWAKARSVMIVLPKTGRRRFGS